MSRAIDENISNVSNAFNSAAANVSNTFSAPNVTKYSRKAGEFINGHISKVDHACLELEKYLNVIGYVPFVGALSGAIRVIYGAVQAIVGLAVAIFAGINMLYHNHKKNTEEAEYYKTLALKGLNYAAQGGLNIGRGFIEKVPGLALITTLPFDLSGKKILKYPTEAVERQRNFDCIHNAGVYVRNKLGIS